MARERFIGFFTTPPFWAAESLPMFANSMPGAVTNLNEQMSQIVLEEDIMDIHVRISYDGLIELRKPDIEDRLHPKTRVVRKVGELASDYSEYMRLINSLFVCLDVGNMEVQQGSMFHIEELTRRDVCRTTYDSGNFSGASIAANSIAGFYQQGRFQTSYRQEVPLSFDTRFQQRRTLALDSIRAGLNHFKVVYQTPQMTEKMATFAKALSDFNAADFSTSIVLCWFLLERTLFERYELYLADKRTSDKHYIDKKRRELLTGRDFTASIVTQILELAESITSEEMYHLDRIRKFRNNIAHHLKNKLPATQDCHDALNFTLKFVFGSVIKEPRVNLYSDRDYPT